MSNLYIRPFGCEPNAVSDSTHDGADRVTVDSSLCRGHARCIALVPEAFDYDEATDQSMPRQSDEISLVPMDRLRMAVRECPERAITLELER